MNFIKKSPWVSFYDSGDCNGCVLEVYAMFNPKYDVERLGVVKKASAKQADVLVVSGIVNKQTKKRLLQVYSQMPEPKIVVAVGSCAITGGVFRSAYNHDGPLDKLIPVNVFVPGCPPRPETLIDGLVKGLALLGKKKKAKPKAEEKAKKWMDEL